MLAEILRDYRRTHGINQADLAQLLSMDQSYISKIETGQREVRDVHMLLRISQQLGIRPARLGLSDDLLRPVASPSTSSLVGESDAIEANQEAWRRTRRRLNRSRGNLARAAAGLYARELRIGSLPFMVAPGWIPDRPVPLGQIELVWNSDAVGAEVTGTEPEAWSVLPLRAPGRRFSRYTSAIRYLDAPKLFENRPSYRLLDAELGSTTGRLEFGLATYFDKLDLSEAVAHELADARDGTGTPPSWNELPLRALVGDPFDLRRRFVMPAVETLTLRRRGPGDATFLLHWRDPAKVATAAGIYGLIPAGEFQPSSVASWDRSNDFSLWRGMIREFSEELLGEPERDGSSGEPLDYENWPLYRSLERGREQGRVRPYCLGVGLDTLTLTATFLTVVVFDADVFDPLFGNTVQINAEGELVTAADSTSVSEGLPFTAATVERLVTREPMASPGACILRQAWEHRSALLG
nr:helix-turn-helix transcriptional regulator [Pseudonocardia sp. C8]